jgi:hypothetical protein
VMPKGILDSHPHYLVVFLISLLFHSLFTSKWGVAICLCPRRFSACCVLNHWDNFEPDNLRKKYLTFQCNVTWSQYQLGSQEK